MVYIIVAILQISLVNFIINEPTVKLNIKKPKNLKMMKLTVSHRKIRKNNKFRSFSGLSQIRVYILWQENWKGHQ